jgi:tellurium resistance protein TerZ
VREQRFAQRGALLLLPAASHTTQSTMGSGASSTAAAAPAKDSKKPVQLLPTHNVQVPSKCARLYFGLSWSAKANIDIDASAVCLAGAQVADIISFQKLRDATPASIVHTGDVLTSGTGTGTTDLERIYVQPELMEKRGVDNIFLVVNVYTQGRTFCDVSSAYARLVHADSDQELARFNLKGCRGDALVFAKLYKHGNKWNWMGLGQQGSGRTAAEVAKALALRMVPPAAVQAAPPPPTIVQVLVQPGMPGQNIQVRAPDGRVLSVLVPPSSIPGSVILVNTAPPPQHGVQAKAPAGGVKVKATKSSAAPALVVASAAGVAAAIAIFAAPNLELSNLGIGATGLVNAAAALEPQELLEAVPTMDPSDFADVVGDLAGDVVSETGDVLMSVGGALSDVSLGDVGDAAGVVGGAASNAAGAVGDAVGNINISGAANAVGGAVSGAANAVGDVFGNIGSVVGTIAEGAGGLFEGLGGFAEMAAGALGGMEF